MFKSNVFAASARCVSGFKALALLAAVLLCGGSLDTAQAAPRISVLETDSCAIATDGRVQCWGNYAAHDGAGAGRAMDVPGFPSDVVGLTGSTRELCALTVAGALWCQGYRPGNGTVHSLVPVMPTGMGSGVTDVARSYQQVCVAKDDGSVWCWGANGWGLGDGSTITSNLPIQVLPPSFDAAGVVAGSNHMCAWSQAGEGRCWGQNAYGQLGHGVTGGSEAAPVTVIGLTGIESMSASSTHTCAQVAGGNVYCWGNNSYRQLGDGTYTNSATPVLATELSPGASQGVFAGSYFTCAQPVDDALVCNGASYYVQIAASGVLVADAGQVALGLEHGCALTNGQAHCWGRNNHGQTGNGRFGDEYAPVKLLGGGYSQAPGVQFDQGCAARQDGSAACWGDSFALPPYVHTQVDGIGGQAQYVGKGARHKCLLREDAKVLCWGWNYNGMLGDGTTDSRVLPTQLSGVSQAVSQLSVGVEHSCALLADTSVVCWGGQFQRSGRGK